MEDVAAKLKEAGVRVFYDKYEETDLWGKNLYDHLADVYSKRARYGYAENSGSWAPLAADLMKDNSVVVPDLSGIGRSSKPESVYDKKTQAKDIRAVVTGLGYDRTVATALCR